MPRISTPPQVYQMLPMPPVSLLPPKTTAAMTSMCISGQPSGGEDAPLCAAYSTPPSAPVKPQMTKLMNVVRVTLMPALKAAFSLPPVA